MLFDLHPLESVSSDMTCFGLCSAEEPWFTEKGQWLKPPQELHMESQVDSFSP